MTGATRGLGRAIAISYAKAGAHVIAVGRTTGALEELDDEIQKVGEPATLVTLDLRKGDKIDGIGPTVFERWGKLDIFVGNAAMLGPLSPLPHVTADAWQHVIDVNLTANWRLIRTLDPLLKRSDAGRVILVSSGAAEGRYAYWGPYAVSKAGVECMGKMYAEECQNTPIRVAIVNGATRTRRCRAKAFGRRPDDAAARGRCRAAVCRACTAGEHHQRRCGATASGARRGSRRLQSRVSPSPR